MRPLTPEQVLAVADEFCAARGVHVRSFGALAACAAVPGARIHGVPVCGSPREGAFLLFDATVRLKPLTDHNQTFAAVLRDTYLRWCDG
ncbi:TetR family transcriptional regulator [Corynebacterium bouchesdurhonense]|uniref:TetR family transcriptional regulator n=1 Tax=Corynebacterium bouchesdurhonense TaxID=1720192 RepID=UPI0008377C8D|nr:TetR family transcriptional regulator [Corynebacterium bouchesdurhonense]